MAYNKGNIQLNNTSAKKKPPKVNIGGVSIVVVFAVLCLTVFAVLSLITSNTEKTLAYKYTDSVRNYYAADVMCSQILQQVSGIVSQNGIGDKDFIPRMNELKSLMDLDDRYYFGYTVSADGRYYFDYTVPIDSNQALRVRLTADSVSDRSLDILMWQVFDIGTWEPDFSIKVWDGGY